MDSKEKIKILLDFCYEQSQSRNDVFFEYSPFTNAVKIVVYVGGYESAANKCDLEGTEVSPDFKKWWSLYTNDLDVEKVKQQIIEIITKC